MTNKNCFSSRKQGKVSSAPELLDGYFLSTDKMHFFFYPCLLFHGVSTALCATLSSSGILHSLLLFVYCVSALVHGVPITLVFTDILGIFCLYLLRS